MYYLEFATDSAGFQRRRRVHRCGSAWCFRRIASVCEREVRATYVSHGTVIRTRRACAAGVRSGAARGPPSRVPTAARRSAVRAGSSRRPRNRSCWFSDPRRVCVRHHHRWLCSRPLRVRRLRRAGLRYPRRRLRCCCLLPRCRSRRRAASRRSWRRRPRRLLRPSRPACRRWALLAPD